MTERQQSADTQVDANLFFNGWQRRYINVYQQGDCPSTRRRKLYGDGGWLSAFGQQPTPSNRQWLSAFSQVDLTFSVLERRLSKLGAAAVALLFVVWVLGPPRKEVSKSPL